MCVCVCALFNRNRTTKLRANRVRHRNHFSDGWMATQNRAARSPLKMLTFKSACPKDMKLMDTKLYVEVACIANMQYHLWFMLASGKLTISDGNVAPFKQKLYPSSNGPFLSTSMNSWPYAIYHPSSSILPAWLISWGSQFLVIAMS